MYEFSADVFETLHRGYKAHSRKMYAIVYANNIEQAEQIAKDTFKKCCTKLNENHDFGYNYDNLTYKTCRFCRYDDNFNL